MSIVETTLVFVGIPAAVILVVAALVYGGAAARTPRYRPGGAWQFEPVWYLPHPEHPEPAGQHEQHGPAANALPAGAGRALPSGTGHTQPDRTMPGQNVVGPILETATASGGASGEW